MSWTIILILAAFWLLGMLTNVGGAFIHFLLVLVLLAVVYKVANEPGH